MMNPLAESDFGQPPLFIKIIIINGVGIAGPTLAHGLRKAGHEVLRVEEASQLRCDGYVIDQRTIR